MIESVPALWHEDEPIVAFRSAKGDNGLRIYPARRIGPPLLSAPRGSLHEGRTLRAERSHNSGRPGRAGLDATGLVDGPGDHHSGHEGLARARRPARSA